MRRCQMEPVYDSGQRIEEDPGMTGKRLVIEGRVQGVGYRASFADEAERLGLRGWVRNRRSGAVEASVHGEAAALEAIIAWARCGPPAALVSAVTVCEEPEAPLAAAGVAIGPTC
jgi:acylphosphatase